ncbi:MAG: FAD-dependent thymidylate synthase [Planctomycetes bacterium]|nr:FAD-dependent thymidylate synthase [Planctomycetota bacterium]
MTQTIHKLLPKEPQVTLVNSFKNPYDNIVATARTCYSSNVVYPEEVSSTEQSRELRDKIFESIFQAGHHTTMQHPTFQFILKDISRQFVWSFLHSHPFYNSEQVSQRYVPVKRESFLVPPIKGQALELYMDTINFQMDGYKKLRKLIDNDVKKEYMKIYPGRAREFEEKWGASVKKKVLELARYILPVATYAHLYHTISGITLYRYCKLSEYFDTPTETAIVVRKMVEEVLKIDPDFFKGIDDPIPLDKTIEYEYLSEYSNNSAGKIKKEFDKKLGKYSSKLVDYMVNTEDVICDAFRLCLGFDKDSMSNKKCFELLLNPAHNKYLSSRLNILSIAKITKSLNHAYFTFMKKISHTADSQDQRHRMVPGTRPILTSKLTAGEPDYIIPNVIKDNQEALEFYCNGMKRIWDSMNTLIEMGVNWEWVQYLLPNAVSIRFYESGSLLYLHHKWTTRLCYLAQEEIWKTCTEESLQIKQKFPEIGNFLHAPCYLRLLSNDKPYCPEGNRFCGVRVWELPLEQFKRII